MQSFFCSGFVLYISLIIARTIYAFAFRIVLFILFFLFIRANSFRLKNFDCPRDENKKRNEKGSTSRLPQSFAKMDKIPTQQSQAAQLMTNKYPLLIKTALALSRKARDKELLSQYISRSINSTVSLHLTPLLAGALRAYVVCCWRRQGLLSTYRPRMVRLRYLGPVTFVVTAWANQCQPLSWGWFYSTLCGLSRRSWCQGGGFVVATWTNQNQPSDRGWY